MPKKSKTFYETMDDTFLDIFKNDKQVIMMGLGINDPKKIFNTTRKVCKKFPNRIFDVPISENSIFIFYITYGNYLIFKLSKCKTSIQYIVIHFQNCINFYWFSIHYIIYFIFF